MKVRNDFVTNSSSSSFIICFTRIADEEKAKKIIEKYSLNILDAEGVNKKRNWYGELGADWCGAIIHDVDDILSEHPNSKYIVITDRNEAYYEGDDYCEPKYDYNFGINATISEITEENGFANINIAEGEGRDG